MREYGSDVVDGSLGRPSDAVKAALGSSVFQL
jgi:hypothetical protein